MSFFEALSLYKIKDEKEMLCAMRDAAEQWYNELTEPFLIVLTGGLSSYTLSVDERLKLAQLANTMLCAELLINNGDALENKLAEIEKSSGIPFFSTRKDLKGRAEEYLQAGEFLKEIAYRAFSKQIATSESCEAALKIAREKWHHFRSAKDALVGQINSQLAKIG